MMTLLLTLEEKEVLLQEHFKKALRNFTDFTKEDLEVMNKLFNEIVNYGKEK